jgi:mRNA-degrading endonuclease toxin of MazEF toxin-antitoxin module
MEMKLLIDTWGWLTLRDRHERRHVVRLISSNQQISDRFQAGRRPVVIISDEAFNERSGTVIAMAITSQPQRAGFPLTFKFPNSHG